MRYEHRLVELEIMYDELRETYPSAAADLGVVIDRIDDDLVLGQDQNKVIEMYLRS